MVFQLDDDLWLPDPRLGEEDGLIAVGGDLSYERLILSYSYGFFPWYAYRSNEILWYCPLQRFVIFPKEIHISHSMRTLIRKCKYRITYNKDFDGVIHACSEVNNRNEEEGAWLGPEIIEAYTKLNQIGLAGSVEVWEDERLVGGLYGVRFKYCFFGESMFSLVPNASKLALITLAHVMSHMEGSIIDCQFETPHLRSMGGRYIRYEEFLKIVNPNGKLPPAPAGPGEAQTVAPL